MHFSNEEKNNNNSSSNNSFQYYHYNARKKLAHRFHHNVRNNANKLKTKIEKKIATSIYSESGLILREEKNPEENDELLADIEILNFYYRQKERMLQNATIWSHKHSVWCSGFDKNVSWNCIPDDQWPLEITASRNTKTTLATTTGKFEKNGENNDEGIPTKSQEEFRRVDKNINKKSRISTSTNLPPSYALFVTHDLSIKYDVKLLRSRWVHPINGKLGFSDLDFFERNEHALKFLMRNGVDVLLIIPTDKEAKFPLGRQVERYLTEEKFAISQQTSSRTMAKTSSSTTKTSQLWGNNIMGKFKILKKTNFKTSFVDLAHPSCSENFDTVETCSTHGCWSRFEILNLASGRATYGEVLESKIIILNDDSSDISEERIEADDLAEDANLKESFLMEESQQNLNLSQKKKENDSYLSPKKELLLERLYRNGIPYDAVLFLDNDYTILQPFRVMAMFNKIAQELDEIWSLPGDPILPSTLFSSRVTVAAKNRTFEIFRNSYCSIIPGMNVSNHTDGILATTRTPTMTASATTTTIDEKATTKTELKPDGYNNNQQLTEMFLNRYSSLRGRIYPDLWWGQKNLKAQIKISDVEDSNFIEYEVPATDWNPGRFYPEFGGRSQGIYWHLYAYHKTLKLKLIDRCIWGYIVELDNRMTSSRCCTAEKWPLEIPKRSTTYHTWRCHFEVY